MYIVEYGESLSLFIEERQAEQIEICGEQWRKRLKLKKSPFHLSKTSEGVYKLRVKGVAGFIRVAGINLEIAPKFLNASTKSSNWKTAMWRFLLYGNGIESLSVAEGHVSTEVGIPDVIAHIFLTSLRGASIKGYPLGYKSQRSYSSFISGRLDPKQFHKLLPATGKIGIISSQLTRDIAINRLLKWATLELSRTVESASRRKRLMHFTDEFPDVSVIPPSIESIAQVHKQYPHLTQAIGISKLLLEGKKATYAEGDFNLSGFLWDSDDLFERAMLRLLSEAAAALGWSGSKSSYKLAHGSIKGADLETHTTPDISITVGKSTVFIADAKYKNIDKKPSNEDFYQILAAGRVKEIPSVALLYPDEGESFEGYVFVPEGNGCPDQVYIVKIGLGSFASTEGVKKLREKAIEWMKDTV